MTMIDRLKPSIHRIRTIQNATSSLGGNCVGCSVRWLKFPRGYSYLSTSTPSVRLAPVLYSQSFSSRQYELYSPFSCNSDREKLTASPKRHFSTGYANSALNLRYLATDFSKQRNYCGFSSSHSLSNFHSCAACTLSAGRHHGVWPNSSQGYKNMFAFEKPRQSCNSLTNANTVLVNAPLGCRSIQSLRPCLSDYTFQSSREESGQWAEAVNAGEKLVAYPTSLMSLRFWMSDEMANVAVSLRQLVGSRHPLVQLVKDTLFSDEKTKQVRGLLILLLSKASGRGEYCAYLESELTEGIHNRQRDLAEITEMIHTVTKIHSSVVQIDTFTDSASSQQEGSDNSHRQEVRTHNKDEEEDLRHGNKIAILSGDYLLAKAAVGLAKLRHTKVVGLMGSAISDLMVGSLVTPQGKRDLTQTIVPEILHPGVHPSSTHPQYAATLNPASPASPGSGQTATSASLSDGLHEAGTIPITTNNNSSDSVSSHEHTLSLTMEDWEREVFYGGGTLLAKSCMSCLLLGGHDLEAASRGYEFGKAFFLCKRLKEEILGIQETGLSSPPFSLVDTIRRDHSKPSGYESVLKDLEHKYTASAVEALSSFEPSEARSALERLVYALPATA